MQECNVHNYVYTYPAIHVQCAEIILPSGLAMIHDSWALSGAFWLGLTLAFNTTHLFSPEPNSRKTEQF